MIPWIWPPAPKVTAASLGITSSDVSNLSGVAGATVTNALNALALAILSIGKPTTANKDMTASVTAADFDLACATALTTTPAPTGGYVAVLVNGAAQSVGDGVRTKSCYFSADGGATARTFAAIVAGDLLYWVGTVAGFQLAASDRIDFWYNA